MTSPRRTALLPIYPLLGVAFGIVAIKTEIVSWYRIQEMFHFHAFHMYGVILCAVAVAALSLWMIRRSGARTITGEPIVVPPKEMGSGRRYLLGGTVFGLGWGLAGACPGPIFALLGAGFGGAALLLFGALLGTRVYAALRPRLPH